MANHPKCPKCGRKFKSGRGLPAHVESCEGKAKKARRPRRAPRRSSRRTAFPPEPRVPEPRTPVVPERVVNMNTVVQRLSAVRSELLSKAAALGKMIEELASI